MTSEGAAESALLRKAPPYIENTSSDDVREEATVVNMPLVFIDISARPLLAWFFRLAAVGMAKGVFLQELNCYWRLITFTLSGAISNAYHKEL